MIKFITCIIILVLLTFCSSFEKLEVETKQTNYKIILTEQPERPELKEYEIDFLYLNNSAMRCFDKLNGDVFNENYYKLLNHIKELEDDNEYLRKQIEINNNH